MAQYDAFLAACDEAACPGGLSPHQQALWHDRNGEWDTAHRIIQPHDDALACRIHAYLHRKEGDESNARYWHRRAGGLFPAQLTLDGEWEMLAEIACGAL